MDACTGTGQGWEHAAGVERREGFQPPLQSASPIRKPQPDGNHPKELIGNAAGNHPKELIGNAVIKGLLLGFSTKAEGGKGGFY